MWFEIGALAITGSWNNERERCTTLIGLKCNGTENFLSDCPLDINFLHCSADSADANVVCPGI